MPQVAAEPDLAPLLSELVDSADGQEIYLRRPERYGLANDIPTTFAEVLKYTLYALLICRNILMCVCHAGRHVERCTQ